MNIIEKCIERCKKNPKKILFPDSLDVRILKAARYLKDNRLAAPVLLGGPIEVREFASRNGIRTQGIKVQYPLHDRNYDQYFKQFYQIRKEKGVTLFDAAEKLRNPLWYAAMAIRNGAADLCIAGNLSNTADILRASIQSIGMPESNKTVSSYFIMISPDKQRIFAFADCRIVPEPSEEQLADIAVCTAENYENLTGQKARVVMLSFSTRGSAEHAMVEKVQQATKLAKDKNGSLLIDGELQFDVAILPEVAQKKAPGSELQGNANVFIFPSLNAGNIGYQITEHLCGFQAVGPFTQGLKKPMHDLPRGCSVEDIINVSIIGSCM